MTHEIPARLADAVAGSYVWCYDENQNRYEDGVYTGRGAWSKLLIDSETRQSFISSDQKYDRQTGYARAVNGYSPMRKLYGQKEYEGKLWADKNRYALIRMIEGINDITVLQEIAHIIGFEEKK